MGIPVRLLAAKLAAAAFALLSAWNAAGQTEPFPDRRITLIVPFPPGGLIDIAARPFGAALERLWKQPVLVTNRPGGGGSVGAVATMQAKPDGYTLLLAHISMVTIPESERVFGRTPGFTLDRFTALAQIVADPLVIVVKGDSPIRTLQDLIEAARKSPGTLAYGSSGNYSAVHVPMEMIAASTGVKFNHVAYSGGGPALTAVLGGHVVATVLSPAATMPQVSRGDLRALARTGGRRLNALPDVPSPAEVGVKGVDFVVWVGLFGPAGMSESVEQAIRAGVASVVRDPEYIAQMAKLNMPIDYLDGPSFRAFLSEDAKRLGAAIQRIGKVE